MLDGKHLEHKDICASRYTIKYDYFLLLVPVYFKGLSYIQIVDKEPILLEKYKWRTIMVKNADDL